MTAALLQSTILDAVLLWAAAVLFWLPLHRRSRFWPRAALCFAVLLAMGLALRLLPLADRSAPFRVVAVLCCLAWGTLAARHCTELPWTGSLYCALWVLLVHVSAFEGWQMVFRQAARVSPVWGARLGTMVWRLLFTALVYALVALTLARLMPLEGSYHIGPRQLSSACLLAAISLFQFFTMEDSPVAYWQSMAAAPEMMTQLYCLTLLYLQTELFKKSAMQKEMDALNLLYDRQRQQYQIAKRNVQLINHKCHELKVQIADLRRLDPDADTRQSLDEAERIARLYDANADTGSEVLDVVLTEKALLCEARQIQLNSVADGSCLPHMDPGDLYALFANVLDHAIENAARPEQADRRDIDLMLFRRMDFAVLSVISPAPPQAEDSAPRAARAPLSTELKVARRIVHKYGGTLATETRSGLFAVKILLPPSHGGNSTAGTAHA